MRFGGVARIRRIPANVSRTSGDFPGASNLERSWALLIVATQRARVAGLYRHGADRLELALTLAASATYAATTPGSAGSAATAWRAHHELNRCQSAR